MRLGSADYAAVNYPVVQLSGFVQPSDWCPVWSRSPLLSLDQFDLWSVAHLPLVDSVYGCFNWYRKNKNEK